MKVRTDYELCDCFDTTCIFTTRLNVYEDIDNYVTEYWVTKDIYNISHATLSNRDDFFITAFYWNIFYCTRCLFPIFLSPI